MTPEYPELDRMHRNMAEIDALLGRSNNQTVTISGNATSLVVSLIAVASILVSVAAVAVIWAWRSADVANYNAEVARVSELRARVMQLEQYQDQHKRRLDRLETDEAGK